jgi:putative zinc finger protein
MRHIPEDELHAYLDQGLSRSQCVEIESHLAACTSCQLMRDSIAALRDRTTALLTRLAPPRTIPPAFEVISRRAAVAATARRRRTQAVAWAASLVVAVGLGWTASNLTLKEEAAARPVQTQPTGISAGERARAAGLPKVAETPAILRPVRKDRPVLPIRRGSTRQTPAAVDSSIVELPFVIAPPLLEPSSATAPTAENQVEFDGVWRTMSWDGAQAEAGDKLVPHIDGLPVLQVQVQSNEQGKQPLMVVAQQLSSGEMIRTIEGPAGDVSHLLAQRTMTDPKPAPTSLDSGSSSRQASDHTDQTMAMQRGDRMLAITGALPSDSLLAMIRRLNAEMRSK